MRWPSLSSILLLLSFPGYNATFRVAAATTTAGMSPEAQCTATQTPATVDVAIVGGGLSGLVIAAGLGNKCSWVLLEAHPQVLGGRLRNSPEGVDLGAAVNAFSRSLFQRSPILGPDRILGPGSYTQGPRCHLLGPSLCTMSWRLGPAKRPHTPSLAHSACYPEPERFPLRNPVDLAGATQRGVAAA